MPNSARNESQSPAARLIERFGVDRLATACGKSKSQIRRLPRPRAVGGTDGLLHPRLQISIIEMAIEAGATLALEEFFPNDLIRRLNASNDRSDKSSSGAAE